MSRAKTAWERAMLAIATGEFYVDLDHFVNLPGDDPTISQLMISEKHGVQFVIAPRFGVIAGDTLEDFRRAADEARRAFKEREQ